MSPKVASPAGSLPDSASQRLRVRAARYGKISFALSLLGSVTGIITGAAIPPTTQSAVITGEQGHVWSHRVWTPTTDLVLWVGLGITVIIAVAALGFGLVGRKVRSRVQSSQTPRSLTLSPSADLGIVIAGITPLTVFVAETISMAAVLLFS